MRTGRIESIDFWRGVALLTIFIDHVPDNLFGRVTGRNFGFSDAAEAFIFLSGVVLAYAHWPKLAAGRAGEVVRRCLKRAGELYLAQIGLTLAAAGMFLAAYFAGGGAGMLHNDNRAYFFDHPANGVGGVLLLSYQFGYFNILSVYVVLMALAAGMFLIMRRSLVAALVVSGLVYAAARNGLAMPSWPLPYTWFLNPFAWQFLFTIGMAVGVSLRGSGIPYSRPVFLLAVAYLALSLAVTTSGWWLDPATSGSLWRPFETDKGVLGVARLTHFLALAYVVGQLRIGERLLGFPAARSVATLGRQSLSMFAAGSLLAALAQIILAQLPSRDGNPLVFHGAAMVLVIAGVAAMILLASWLADRQARVRDLADGVMAGAGRAG